MERISKKDATAIKEQDFFTINSLLWPKGELVLMDAVHSVFKGFRVQGCHRGQIQFGGSDYENSRFSDVFWCGDPDER